MTTGAEPTDAATTTARMPAAFVGHGTPMNALEDNRYTRAWRALGTTTPRPRAILAVSAHWYVDATAVTAMARPRTVHDFYGFPPELYAVEYPAPGDPGLAEEVADTVAPTRVGSDADSWGIDHGTWSVLVHAFPSADVPVVQLSVNAAQPFDYHLELGARLAPLRERGILVLASGNVVHNLRSLDWSRPELGFDWARSFDERAAEIMTSSPADIGSLVDHDAYRAAAPTPDHLLPLLYLAGLASASGERARVLVDGYAMGALSMTAYTIGDHAPGTVPTGGDGSGADR